MDKDQKKKVFDIIKKEIGVYIPINDPLHNLKDLVPLDSIDSMQVVSIIAKIEEEFSIELPISIMEVNTLDEFLSVIDQKM